MTVFIFGILGAIALGAVVALVAFKMGVESEREAHEQSAEQAAQQPPVSIAFTPEVIALLGAEVARNLSGHHGRN